MIRVLSTKQERVTDESYENTILLFHGLISSNQRNPLTPAVLTGPRLDSESTALLNLLQVAGHHV